MLYSGRSTRWNERCAPPWSGSSTSIPLHSTVSAAITRLLSPLQYRPNHNHHRRSHPVPTPDAMPPRHLSLVSASHCVAFPQCANQTPALLAPPVVVCCWPRHVCTPGDQPGDELKPTTFQFRAPYLPLHVKSPLPLLTAHFATVGATPIFPPSSPVYPHHTHVRSDTLSLHTGTHRILSAQYHSPPPSSPSPLPHSSSPKLQRH